MAYNHGREDRKWRIWKEAEEKLLRECGVDEATIEQIRMFTKAFTVGLNVPSKRITEPEWMTLFSNMMSGMLQCSCGAQFFYDEDLEAKGVKIIFPESTGEFW